MYPMDINCIFCDTPAIIKKAHVYMKCMCDDDFRIVPLNEIKSGFYTDKVYLLEKKKGNHHEEFHVV